MITQKFIVGQKVTTSGFPGVIVRQYSEGLYEVRLGSGMVCVDQGDIKAESISGVTPEEFADAYRDAHPDQIKLWADKSLGLLGPVKCN